MAKEKKSVSEKYTTEKGTLTGFISLFEPSTKFNKEGVYQAHLLLSKDEGEKLASKIKEIRTQQFKQFGKGTKVAELTQCVPYTTVNDETGEEIEDAEGRYVLKSKASAFIKDGKITQRIPVLDAKLKPVTGIKVGEGTTAKLGVELVGYSVAGKTGVSVKLRLVQIINLVEYSGGATAESFGLTQEDGFDFEESDVEETTTTEDEVEDGESEEVDF